MQEKTLREEAIDYLIDAYSNYYEIDILLYDGFKGFRNESNAELLSWLNDLTDTDPDCFSEAQRLALELEAEIATKNILENKNE